MFNLFIDFIETKVLSRKGTVASILFASLLGIWLLLPDSEQPQDVVDSPVSEAENAVINQQVLETQTQLADATVEKSIEVAAEEESEESLIEEEPEAGSASEMLAKTLDTLEKRIAADKKELLDAAAGPNEDYELMRRELLRAIKQNPELASELLDRFLQNPDSKLSRELSAVLSEVGTPEVQDAVLSVGLDAANYNNDERAAALLTVAGMEKITGETRDRLLDSYSETRDSRLMQFSLMALKSAPSTQEDYARVHEALSTVVQSEDKNIRRHSAYQIGEWATSNDDLAPLREMAMYETDVNARARAIGSIGKSTFKSDQNKEVLWHTVNNSNEWAVVRELAWKSLQGYPLTTEELDYYHVVGESIKQAAQAELSSGG